MGEIVMLSGPVGAGKTTVAKHLVQLLPEPVCSMEGDAFWPFFERPGSLNRRDNFGILMRSVTAAAIPFARSGYTALLDFSFPPQFLPTAKKIVKEIPLQFVVLRPRLAVCEQRAANRSEGRIADYAYLRDLYATFDGFESHTVSDDGNADKLAQQIRDGLHAGRFRVPA